MMERWKRVFGGTVALLALVIWTGGGEVAAQTVPRDQTEPDVVYLGDRQEFLLVWAEDHGAGWRVLAKRVRANGLPVGGPSGGDWEIAGSVAPAGQKGDQRWPAVTDGLLVWSEKLPGATDYDIYAQRLFANGRTQGQPTLVAGGPGDQRYADVTPNVNNEWLVVWSEDSNDGGDVMGRRISVALTPRGTAFPIAQGPGVSEDPVISRDPFDSSYFLVLFTDDRNGNKDIFGTRLASNGLPRSGSTGGQFPVIDSPQDDYAPGIAVGTIGDERSRGDASRNILVWTTDTLADGPDVLGQRLRTNGYAVGAPFTIAGGPGPQAWPAISLHDAEEWLAVWAADVGGTLDVLSVDVRKNGIPRPTERVLAAD